MTKAFVVVLAWAASVPLVLSHSSSFVIQISSFGLSRMLDPVRHALLTALDGRSLSQSEAAAAIGEVMDGRADEILVASLLTALRAKGESAEELYGAARAMRDRAARIPARTPGLLDTCGTGGDGLATFNI